MGTSTHHTRYYGAYVAFGAASCLFILAMVCLSDGFSNFDWEHIRQNRLLDATPVLRSLFARLPNPGLMLSYALFIWPAFALRKGAASDRWISACSFLMIVIILFLFIKS
ncbi:MULTISPECIES: hypothetical protein [unclassified Flavobacterium]|uniref:hypothetical protein n=1 Tax=unclassified Flavobacterium TaxID=196869 RepID=UPI001F145798|nr:MULTISPECIES: hypothetical protein [unclassified Flavobacterium]UMY67056.1 hypothetical protein MKO97_06670 [Flavobacterium sp. HJ-32-4]